MCYYSHLDLCFKTDVIEHLKHIVVSHGKARRTKKKRQKKKFFFA